MTHAALPGGWRAATLMDAVAGIIPADRALWLVGARSGETATKAARDLDDAISAYRAGQHDIALATATDLAESIRQTRQTGKGAAA